MKDVDGPLTKKAKAILEDYPIRKVLPASISGKYHVGETHEQHINMAVNVMKELCREFKITGEERDMLIAATYLHDIGIYIITQEGNSDIKDWKYYKDSNYSRSHVLMSLHPLIGAKLIDSYNIGRKQDIKRLVSVHMSHWYEDTCPQPKNFYERLVCIADYVASKGDAIFKEK